MRRAHLTVRCRPGYFDDSPPTLDRFEGLVKKLLAVYGKETGDYIPMLGVSALQRMDPDMDDREAPRWPHCHLLFQHWLRDPDAPVKDSDKLEALARLFGLNVKLKIHDADERDGEGNLLDMVDYVARHLRAGDSARILAGKARTNFTLKSPAEARRYREFSRAMARKKIKIA